MAFGLRHYGVGGSAGACTAGTPWGTLWNPSGSVALYVTKIECLFGGAGNTQLRLRRTTTRGTPASTVTPDADNDFNRHVIPPSGALLDLGNYSAAPTIDGSDLMRFRAPSIHGSGGMFYYGVPIEVPPGTGLAVIDFSGVIAGQTVSCEWDE